MQKEEVSLKKKTVRGVGWSAVDTLSRHGVQFVVGIVLARLLSPDDYGLLGLVAIFTVVCTTIINGGFTSALIRTKDATDDDYNTAFIVNMGMSLTLYAVIFLCAPLIAAFFGRDELVALSRVTSLGLIFGALGLVQQTRLTKRIDFKTQTKITLAASIVSGITGIALAYLGFGVWALVAQQLTSQVLTTLQLYLYNRWLPALRFSRDSFHRLFGFGWKIMASQIMNTLWKELTQVVIGKCYAPAALGQYTRAKHFETLLSSNITDVVQRVTYPVLSNIQDERDRMVAAYRRIIRMSSFATATATLALAAVAEPLIYCLIGPKWHEAAEYLPVMCISGSLYPIIAINMNMLSVQGRSGLLLLLEVVKKTLEFAPLLLGVFVGILPMLYGYIGVHVVGYLLNSYYSGRRSGYSTLNQLRDVAPAYGVGVAVACSVYFLKYLPLSYWVTLPLQIVVGAIVFFTICRLTQLPEYQELKSLVLKKTDKHI